MHKFYRTYHRIAAVAVMGAVVLTGTAQLANAQAAPAATPGAAPAEKKVKDQGEYDIYNQTLKDMTNPAALLKDLDTWKQKYPDSDWKDDRQYYYITAYNGTNQPAKVLEIGSQLMGRDLKKVFTDPKAGPQQILTVLYLMSVNLLKLPNATPEQIATGEKAAHQLLDFAPQYFSAANKPAGTSDADWAKARADIEKQTNTALAAMTIAPANQALAKNDCATADQLFTKALGQYPNNTLISYSLARALSCEARANPDKSADFATRAIYEFVRAAEVDPTLGGTAQAAQITAYAKNVYTQYHGSEEGLDKLREQAKASPLPPAGFAIESKVALDAKREKDFMEKEPQIALWMSLKRQLTDTNGQQYFDGQLKDADVVGQNGKRALKATVLEGRPACRSKELLVTVPQPGQPAGKAEITLKLDAALTGKPQAGDTIEFDAIPRAFSKEPFMLTMETEKAKISDLKVEPCAATPARPAAKARKKK